LADLSAALFGGPVRRAVWRTCPPFSGGMAGVRRILAEPFGGVNGLQDFKLMIESL
jgi:hypothetical protein